MQKPTPCSVSASRKPRVSSPRRSKPFGLWAIHKAHSRSTHIIQHSLLRTSKLKRFVSYALTFHTDTAFLLSQSYLRKLKMAYIQSTAKLAYTKALIAEDFVPAEENEELRKCSHDHIYTILMNGLFVLGRENEEHKKVLKEAKERLRAGQEEIVRRGKALSEREFLPPSSTPRSLIDMWTHRIHHTSRKGANRTRCRE
jgi:hypothetical protein